MIVVLLGYMASGKSVVGKKLANTLNYDFIDLDSYIETKESVSISELFQTKGEIYFRKIETLTLKEILNSNKNLVLSLGGGTPCYADNMDLINQSISESFYLKTSINSLALRLVNEAALRPLIAHIHDLDALKEFVGKHLFERSSYYTKAKKMVITDEKSPEEIVEKIILELF